MKNNNQYVANDIDEITSSTKFLNILLNDKIKLPVDIQSLMKTSVHSENAWINVTPTLTEYNIRFANWIQNKNVKEYINVVNNKFLNVLDSRQLKSIVPFPKSQWYTKEKFDWLNNDCPLICTRRGKYNSGTYLHKNLFLKFITVLDVEIEVAMHEAIMDIIKQADIVKIDRVGTKTAFHELTDTIKDIYIPAQKSQNSKKFAYSTLMTLANIKVLGMKAEKYCKLHNIEVTDEMISVRDALPKDKLELIKKAEEYINGFIKYGGITDYNVLKQKLLGVNI